MIALSQILKYKSAGIRASLPVEESIGTEQCQLDATQKTFTDTLLRVTICLDDDLCHGLTLAGK